MDIANLTKHKIDKRALKKVVQQAIKVLGKKDLEEISLVFVGDDKMKELNKKYRHKNRVTDVLSFEQLNEIFICLPQAERQAKVLKHSLNCELTRLLVHGIVHLKGYDHERGAKQAARMLAVENKILKSLN